MCLTRGQSSTVLTRPIPTHTHINIQTDRQADTYTHRQTEVQEDINQRYPRLDLVLESPRIRRVRQSSSADPVRLDEQSDPRLSDDPKVTTSTGQERNQRWRSEETRLDSTRLDSRSVEFAVSRAGMRHRPRDEADWPRLLFVPLLLLIAVGPRGCRLQAPANHDQTGRLVRYDALYQGGQAGTRTAEFNTHLLTNPGLGDGMPHGLKRVLKPPKPGKPGLSPSPGPGPGSAPLLPSM
ncbi:unnamed protein product, partial [Protopolystoma xenopodis]